MKVIVCGGRAYHDIKRMFDILDGIAAQVQIDAIIHGGANGADAGAEMWARHHKIPTIVYPADWTTHGRKAGPIRNKLMAENGADMLVAFPGGAGTANMIKQARAKKILVRIVA